MQAPHFAAALAKKPPHSVCIQLQADLLRTELLSKYGGVWVDMTTQPVQPLEVWLPTMLRPSGFWAFTETPATGSFLSRTPGSTSECFNIPRQTDSIKCYPSWVYQNHHDRLYVFNWFLAVDRPHHPLIDSWFVEYHRALEMVGPTRPAPYFLHMCTLSALHHNCAVRETLEAMPYPCGFKGNGMMAAMRSVPKSGSKQSVRAINPALFMYKRAALDNETYTSWIDLVTNSPGNTPFAQLAAAKAKWVKLGRSPQAPE